jgi:hypothetical protein
LFPNTVRANPEVWKEELIAEIFKISKEGKGMPVQLPPVNNALSHFLVKAQFKEGWKFLDCLGGELREVLKYLVPLINPMKLGRVSGKLENSVVESLYLGKKLSWARVLEEVIDQQVWLLGPNNLNSSLARYLARIYAANRVLTRPEQAANWLT